MYPPNMPTSTGNTNRSRLGARAREDPLGAASEILAAHRRHKGTADTVAAELGVTVHTLRIITRGLSGPRKGAGLPLFQGERGVLFDTAAGKRPRGYKTLLESIERVRGQAKDPEGATTPAPSAKRVQIAIDAFVARGTASLATLAASVVLEGDRTLDQGLLSRFRRGKKALGPALRRKIFAAAEWRAGPARFPWEHPRLAGLYPHHVNGATYLCSEGDGVPLGVIFGDGSGTWYDQVEGPAGTVEAAAMAGPSGWEAAGKKVVVERNGEAWYWLVRP